MDLAFTPGAALFVEMDFQIPNMPSVYLDLVMYGPTTESRWLCYLYDGVGSQTSLGDGWYLIRFQNLYATELTPEYQPPEELANSILLSWNHLTLDGARLDNFTIQAVPEPAETTAVLALAGLGALLLRRNLLRKRRGAGTG